MNNWHEMKSTDVCAMLRTNPEAGLSGNEAQRRLAEYGSNEIKSQKKVSAFTIFLAQFSSPLVLLLILAAAASFLFERGFDAILIVNRLK